MPGTVWSKTLRDYRVPVLGWGIGLGLAIGLTLAYVSTLTYAARMAEAQYAQSIRFIGDPVAVETPAGYATWHTAGWLPVMLGIWTVIAGARLLRGEEERGALDLLMATPLSRTRLLVEKLGAFVVAVLSISLLIALGGLVGQITSGIGADVTAALLTGVNAALVALIYGMLAFVLSQLLGRRTAAAGWAGGLLIAGYLLNATGRTITNGEWLRRLTPFYYYDLSKPLITSYGSNAGALLLLAGISFALALVSVPLFLSRDVGGSALPAWHIPLPERTGEQAITQARRDVFLRSVGLRGLRADAGQICWWMFGLIAGTAWITFLARRVKDAIAEIVAGAPGMRELFGQFDLGTDSSYVALVAFMYIPVLLVLFAMTLSSGWLADLESGRMELVLGEPQSRWRIYAERFAVIVAASILAPLVAWLVILVSARVSGMDIDMGRFALAFGGIIPLELLTAALVYALAGWLRAAAVISLVAIFITVSYLMDLLNPLLKLPDWLVSLSIFHQYGNPLLEDPRWVAWLVLAVIATALFAIGARRFASADIRSGS